MKILVALSGGLDSAAAILLLRKNGFEHNCVEAVFFDMFGDPNSVENAIKVAKSIDVVLHIVDCVDEFKKTVLQHFMGVKTRCVIYG